MTRGDLVALLPLIVAAYLPVLVLSVGAFRRGGTLATGLSLAGLAAALATLFIALPLAPRQVTPLFLVDRFSLFFVGLSLAAAAAVLALSHDYLEARGERGDRFCALVLFAVAGMAIAASASHFASFFLGLETLTVSLYGLVGFTRARLIALEGSIKYLILGAVSSAFLLFGVALVYAETGTLEIEAAARALRDVPGEPSTAALLGLGLIVVGFGFKLALVPFHMWSPDVYQGAPAPATALVSSGSKAAIFALFFRFFTLLGGPDDNLLFEPVWVLAVVTMLGGNLLALLQRNVKRMLAYSSVAHMGYLLVPLLAGGRGAAAAFGFYLVSYAATVIAAFGVLAALSARAGREVDDLDALRGLGYRQPLPAAVMALAMLSLTGIPLTSGFIAKFYAFGAGVRADLWGLVLVAVVASGLSATFYLRVLLALYTPLAPGAPVVEARVRPWSAASLAALAAVVVLFGLYPAPLVRLAGTALGDVTPTGRVVAQAPDDRTGW